MSDMNEPLYDAVFTGDFTKAKRCLKAGADANHISEMITG